MKIIILLFLLAIPFVSAVQINEIMYNPPGSDSGSEWIELYDVNVTNLSGWSIGDLNSNDTLFPLFISNGSYYLIITKNISINNSNFSNFSIYYCGPTIGNGLGNTGDSIFLYDENKTLVDAANYSDEFANGNNKTLEKFNNSWHESLTEGGTPGSNNSFLYIFDNISTGNENVSNQTNITETNLRDVCISEIKITTTKEIYADEPIKFKHVVNSSEDFSIIYWIEDLFENIVKDEYETRTLSEKSFTPKSDEKDKVFIIKSILKGCEESDAEKIVIYKTEDEIEQEASASDDQKETATQEESALQNKTKFSYELLSYSKNITDEVQAVVKIDSDDNNHLVRLSAYLYRGSKKYSDVAEYEFTIEKFGSEAVELNMKPNATEGDYKLKIKINKDNQKTDYEITVNVTVNNPAENIAYNFSEAEESEDNYDKELAVQQSELNISDKDVIYQSKKAKSYALTPIILIMVLFAISAVLIWKR